MPLPTPDLPAGDRFALALQTCRRFLLTVANARMRGCLTPRGGASDVVQETLIKGFNARDQFHGHTLDDLRAWLRTILLHEMADFRRHRRAARRDAAREVPGETDRLPGVAAEPVDHLIRAERDAAVAAALARLPPAARLVVVLRLDHRLGFREIGDRLGRTEEAARKAFTRALEELRRSAPAA